MEQVTSFRLTFLLRDYLMTPARLTARRRWSDRGSIV
jgi:hypothetical protein